MSEFERMNQGIFWLFCVGFPVVVVVLVALYAIKHRNDRDDE